MQDPQETASLLKEEETDIEQGVTQSKATEPLLEIKIEDDNNPEQLFKKLKDVRKRIFALLDETNIKVKAATKVQQGIKVFLVGFTNAGAFTLFRELTQNALMSGIIGSLYGSLIGLAGERIPDNKLPEEEENPDKDKGYKRQSLFRVPYGIGLSEGIRGLGTFVKQFNAPVGIVLETLLPSFAQGMWWNNSAKDAAQGKKSDDLLKELQILIAEEEGICEQLKELKDKNLIKEDFQGDATFSKKPMNMKISFEVEQELEKKEERILELLEKAKVGWRVEEAGSIVLGILGNGITFIALSTFAPGLGMFKGPIAGATGAVAKTVTDKFTKLDSGPAIKSIFKPLDSIGISEGVRGLSSLVTKLNVPVGMFLETVLPALAQSDWINSASKNSNPLIVQLKNAIEDYNKFCEKNELPKRFVFETEPEVKETKLEMQ